MCMYFIGIPTLWVYGTSRREWGALIHKESHCTVMYGCSLYAVPGYCGISRSRCFVQLWLPGVWQFTCGECVDNVCTHIYVYIHDGTIIQVCRGSLLAQSSSIACDIRHILCWSVVQLCLATYMTSCYCCLCMKGAEMPLCCFHYSVWQVRAWHTGEMSIFSFPSHLTQG